MCRPLLTFGILLICLEVQAQVVSPYQQGITAEKNLQAIISLSPYSDGAVGFDTRYQGIKGSPRLFDSLLTSFLRVKGQDYYIQVEADLDIAGNSVLFNHPTTHKLTAIPSEIVSEIIFKKDEKDLLFRTSTGMAFDKTIKVKRFIQVLKDAPVPFIRMPFKTFREADYKGAYSPDRRYDEFETVIRYYIMGPDNVFHHVTLNKKSLIKLYPDKKNIIDSAFREKSTLSDENLVISILDKF